MKHHLPERLFGVKSVLDFVAFCIMAGTVVFGILCVGYLGLLVLKAIFS